MYNVTLSAEEELKVHKNMALYATPSGRGVQMNGYRRLAPNASYLALIPNSCAVVLVQKGEHCGYGAFRTTMDSGEMSGSNAT